MLFGLYLRMTQRSEQKSKEEKKKIHIRAKGKKIQRHALSGCIDYAFFSTFIPLLSFLQPAAKSVSVLCVYDSSLNLIKRLLT